MVKSKLVQKLCNIHPNILRKDMEKIVEIIFSEITYALCRNETVEIRGFGRFKAVVRKSRVGRNPKNSNAVQIPEKKVRERTKTTCITRGNYKSHKEITGAYC